MKRFFVAVTRHPLSFLGSALATATAVVFLTLFGMSQLGFEGGPYFGIMSFLILPGILVLGLLLIPAGMAIERRRRKGSEAPAGRELPVIDLNNARTRGAVLTFIALTLLNTIIIALATYKGVEVMDSTPFCGATCHSVMAPEYTAYKRSPHAQVQCVACHIGPGAGWFVKSKLSGSWQVISVAFSLYPRPIPTPVQNLRPARETCEQCHWPSKFVGDRLKVITHHADDEANTERKTVLLVRVGGLQGRRSQGIHWHVDPAIRIRYLADRTRETISKVELRRADGTIQLFSAPENVAAADGAAAGGESRPGEGEAGWRTMDCVDCHNRPTHIYRAPEDEIDASLQQGRIDSSLPFIRREGLKVLRETHPSQDEARSGIRQRLRAFYATAYPAFVTTKPERLEEAARELGQIYCANVFPPMKITWGTYPNHIGHQNSPGCFRCHDELHKSADGRAISQDCSTCHTLLAMDEENPAILQQLQP